MNKLILSMFFISSLCILGCAGGGDGGSSAQAEDPSGDEVVNRMALQKIPTQNDTLSATEFNSIKTSFELSFTTFLRHIGSPLQIISNIRDVVYPSNGSNTCSTSDLPVSVFTDSNNDGYPDSTFSGNFQNCVSSNNTMTGYFTSVTGQSFTGKYELGNTNSSAKSYVITDMTKTGSGNNASMTFRFKHGLTTSPKEYMAVWLSVNVSAGTPTVSGYVQMYKESTSSFKTYKLSMSGITYNSSTECLGGTLSATDDTTSVTITSGSTSSSNFMNSEEQDYENQNIEILGGVSPVFCLKYNP